MGRGPRGRACSGRKASPTPIVSTRRIIHDFSRRRFFIGGHETCMKTQPVFSLLAADGPQPALREKLMLYGQFVGSWVVEAVWFMADGSRPTARGEWHFAWALGGRAVQDVLFAKDTPADERGTTLRGYDHTKDHWHITWMQPASGEFTHLIGRSEGERIVQESVGETSSCRKRWSFCDITPASFLWLGEESGDGGQTWRVVQEMRATRMGEA